MGVRAGQATVLFACGMVALAACDTHRGPSPTASPSATPEASPPSSAAASAEASSSSSARAPTTARASRDAAAGDGGVRPALAVAATSDAGLGENTTVAPLADGKATFFTTAAEEGRTTDILVAVSDAHGKRQAARRIRRTSGEVVALSAFVEGQIAWIAWRARTESTSFGAVMRVQIEPWKTMEPKMLGLTEASLDVGSVRVISDGHAGAIVATNAPPVVVPCFLAVETPPCRGPAIVVGRVPVDPDTQEPRPLRILYTRGLDGGPLAEIRGLALASPSSLFVDVRAMRGGALTDAALVSLDAPEDGGAAAVTHVRTAQCGVLDHTYVVDGSVVTVADNGYWSENEVCPASAAKTLWCPTMGRAELEPKSPDAGASVARCTPILSHKRMCQAGRAVDVVRDRIGEVRIPLDEACGG